MPSRHQQARVGDRISLSHNTQSKSPLDIRLYSTHVNSENQLVHSTSSREAPLKRPVLEDNAEPGYASNTAHAQGSGIASEVGPSHSSIFYGRDAPSLLTGPEIHRTIATIQQQDTTMSMQDMSGSCQLVSTLPNPYQEAIREQSGLLQLRHGKYLPPISSERSTNEYA